MERTKATKGAHAALALMLAGALAFGGTFAMLPQAYAEPEAVAADEGVGADVGSDTGSGTDVGSGGETGTDAGNATEHNNGAGLPAESADELLAEPMAAPEADSAARAVSPTGDVAVDTVADLIDAVNNATEDRTITLTAAFQADFASVNAAAPLNNLGGHAIVIDGGGLSLTRAGAGKSFTLTNSAAGSMTLQNLTMTGVGAGATISAAGGSVVFDQVVITGHTDTALHITAGNLVIRNTVIENGARAVSSGAGGTTIDMADSLFSGNSHGWGAALTTGSNTTVTIARCNFVNNIGTYGGGYCGGAIATDQASNVNLSITQSYFEGNEAPMAGAVAGGSGGAISVYNGNNNNLSVTDSYFVANKAVANQTVRNDGGAISVLMSGGGTATAKLDNCVFENNVSNDDGGAILFEGVSSGSASINLDASVTNCTFVGNEGKQLTSSIAGGAVQVFSKARVAFLNCTFYDNHARGGSGGAIGLSGGLAGGFLPIRPAVTVENSVFSENTGAGGANYNNVAGWGGAGTGGLTNKGGNVGYDAGTALHTEYSAQTVFGTAAPLLQSNNTSTVVGTTTGSAATVLLPSLYIAPNVDSSLPLYADGIATANATPSDSRYVVRNAAKPDAGAVDIGWIKLDPNGGTWNDTTIGDYATTHMLKHVTDGGDEFVYAASDSGTNISLPGSTMFSATPADGTLLGWGKSPTTQPGDADFHAIGAGVVNTEEAGGIYYAIWENAQEFDLTVARLFGIDRYGTSNQISKYERVAADEDTVILASGWGYNFPDALTASALSGYLDNAPIVLTDNEYLSEDARATIVDDLGISRVIIVGNPESVSQNVEDEVNALPGVTTVERVGGVDRQETAELIFDYLGANHSDTAIIARCCDFPDSLTISPWAAATKSPIFLSDFGLENLTEETKAELAAGGFTRIIVLGDENATPQSVYEQARDAAGLTDADMVRLGGIDRYETSALVAEWVTSDDRPDAERLTWAKPAISRGDVHADSLTGGALQGRDRSIILLTPPDSVSTYSYPLVEAKDGTIVEIRFFGDENAVSFDVTKDFINALTYDSVIWKPDASVAIPLI